MESGYRGGGRDRRGRARPGHPRLDHAEQRGPLVRRLASEAGFSLLAAPVLRRLGPACVSLYACLAAAALLGLGAAASGGPAAFPPPSPAEGAAIAYLAVATPVAFVSWYTSIGRLGVARTGVFAALVPVGTFVTAVVIASGTFQPLRATGTMIVGAGLALAFAPRRSQ